LTFAPVNSARLLLGRPRRIHAREGGRERERAGARDRWIGLWIVCYVLVNAARSPSAGYASPFTRGRERESEREKKKENASARDKWIGLWIVCYALVNAARAYGLYVML